MKVSSFIGVDVSKNTLDIAICQEAVPEKFLHQQFPNTLTGCKKMLTWLKKQQVDLRESFFIMEHTGWYTLLLCCYLQEADLLFGLYSPLHLKRSLGLTRGKTDKVDAQRLAYYAFLHRHALKPTPLPSASLLKLKNLFAFRDRLVKTQASLKVTMNDLKATDFYGLSKRWCIVFFIFCTSFNNGKNAFDKLIPHRINYRHLVLTLRDFALIILS